MQRPLSILLMLIACGCGSADSDPPAATVAPPASATAARPARPAVTPINPRLLRRFKPLGDAVASAGLPAAGEPEVQVGRMLFFDKRLSRDGDLSCNSCHRLDRYGVDHEVTSIGAKGKRGRRNSPTVFHASGHVRSFWDGRAENVEEQAKGPILNPDEMAMPDAATVVAVVKAIPGYVTAFHDAFPTEADPITYDNIGHAIGAFERKLATPSRWDRYLAGDTLALSVHEVSGLKLFLDLGCTSCHTGELIGGSTFQKAGAVEAWPNQADQGRFEFTQVASDRMIFKVPSLRNIEKTAPYFHDGSVATLEDAVIAMARHQLGEDLSPDDVKSIVAWLGSLTGDLPAEYVAAPVLPPDAR